MSVLAILQFIVRYSDYYNIIVFTTVIAAYFAIEWVKHRVRQPAEPL